MLRWTKPGLAGERVGKAVVVHHKVPVSCAIEVRHRKPGTKLDNRKDGRYAGRVRLAVVLDRSAESLCGFVESTVAPGSLIVTDDWSGYAGLGKRGYEHFAVAECGDPEVAEQYLPIIHLVFANLKTWLIGIHHGVSHQHLQSPTSTSSPSASTGGSTRSTPSAHCSASRATPLLQPMPSFTRESGGTLHVAVMGVNRIGKDSTKYDVANENIDDILDGVMEIMIPHPTDTHPSVGIRLNALGIERSQITKDMLLIPWRLGNRANR